MHSLIEAHRAQIEALCRRFGVRRLDVFGSVLRSDFDAARSDVDIVVDFEQAAPGEELDQYFRFKEELERLLGLPVELIELDAMENTRLKRIIERARIPVYAASA